MIKPQTQTAQSGPDMRPGSDGWMVVVLIDFCHTHLSLPSLLPSSRHLKPCCPSPEPGGIDPASLCLCTDVLSPAEECGECLVEVWTVSSLLSLSVLYYLHTPQSPLPGHSTRPVVFLLSQAFFSSPLDPLVIIRPFVSSFIFTGY